MVLPDNEEHAAFWADDLAMGVRTEAYRKKLAEALRSKILKKETKHPWSQQDHKTSINWRLRIFEIAGNDGLLRDKPLQLNGPRDTLMYLENMQDDEYDEVTSRRVIVMEDINPRLAELMGVLLDIPPEFFLSHCENSVDLSVVNAPGLKQGNSTYWKVPVPQRRNIPGDFKGPYGQYRVTSGLFNRGEVTIQKDMKSAKLYSYVSYWGMPYGEDSWTDVILVDSKKMYMHEASSPLEAQQDVYLESWKPVRDVSHEVTLGSSKKTQPYARSLFGAISEMHNHSVPIVSEDPFSGTVFARSFIFAVWEEHILRLEGMVYDAVFKDPWRTSGYGSTDSFQTLKEPKDDTKVVRHYQWLVEKRRNLLETRKFLRDVMWKFHCGDAELPALEASFSLRRTMMQESRQWKLLDKKIEYLQSAIADQMEVHTQRAAMENAYAAKAQARESSIQTAAASTTARNSGRLMKIAAIIAPCMLVALVFSMLGKFAPGEPLFFVYWGVSIVLSCAVLGWVVYRDVIEGVKSQAAAKDKKTIVPRSRRASSTDETVKIKSKFAFFNFKRQRPSLSETSEV